MGERIIAQRTLPKVLKGDHFDMGTRGEEEIIVMAGSVEDEGFDGMVVLWNADVRPASCECCVTPICPSL
jgi:hypothetical protein